jgi:hypothetical protein
MNHLHRRTLLKSSVFGLLAASIPNLVFAGRDRFVPPHLANNPHPGYPSLDKDLVSEVVGKSHFDLERVKELVNQRPELSRSVWDWGFGDFESAIGAASHVGREDIVQFLRSRGARPTLFTYAMLGQYEVVKATCEANPGIQQVEGPHGFNLMFHARIGLRIKGRTSSQKEQSQRLVDYLQQLGDADPSIESTDLAEADKQAYLGDYKYGDGPEDGFSVKLNMRKLLSLGKIGSFGGALFCVAPDTFRYNGTSSVTITFQRKLDQVVSLTLEEPGLTLTATKV